MNPKKAECVGLYGYGNGYLQRDFCGTDCKVSRYCWERLINRVESDDSLAEEVRAFKLYLARFKKWGKAVRRFILRHGKPDPYFQQMSQNTNQGYSDNYLFKSGKRKSLMGGVWFWGGRYVQIRGLGAGINPLGLPKEEARDTVTSGPNRGSGGERRKSRLRS